MALHRRARTAGTAIALSPHLGAEVTGADHVVGLRPAESRALLDDLLAWSTQVRFCYLHQWQVGDLVAWDSTAILHRTSAAGDEVAA